MSRAWGCTLVMLAGCGGSGLDLAPVTGVVTLDGQPVADAGIVFSPVDPQQGPAASGATDSEGRFTMMTNNLEGALLGEHRVCISKADAFGIEIPAEEFDNPDFVRRGLKVFKTKHHLPIRYSDFETSNLTAKVIDDDNYIEFSLSN